MPRKILLLQGPVGPFFAKLRKCLQTNGMAVDHVLFNLGDVLFAAGKGMSVFRGTDAEWQRVMTERLDANTYAAVVMFGSARDRHRFVLETAGRLNIPVLCLEEGYIRPGYVTAEKGGNNAHSPLATEPLETFLTEPPQALKRRAPQRAFGQLVWFGFCYYVARWAGYLAFRHVQHHKRRFGVLEFGLWARNVYRKIAHGPRNRRRIAELAAQHRNAFFLIPLQVHDDMQLRRYGRGWTNEKLVDATIRSFALHAPCDHRLVIKVHPMDRGHHSIEDYVAKAALQHACADRVVFLDDGVMGQLTRICAGMVTINSTSALSALLHNVPVGVFGDAIFRRPGLVNCLDGPKDLDDFWCAGRAAEEDLAKGFRRHLIAQAQVPGDFYHRTGSRIAVDNIVERLNSLLAENGAPPRFSDQAMTKNRNAR